jgi:hypothetical protein
MKNYRDDDIEGMIRTVVKARGKKPHKLRQEWTGEVVVIEPTKVSPLQRDWASASWRFSPYSAGNAGKGGQLDDVMYIVFTAAYRAAGANANDAVQMACKAFGVEPRQVGVRTLNVVHVADRFQDLKS